MEINKSITPDALGSKLDLFWKLSGDKILSIEQEYDKSKGAPVFTENGKYTTRGWTEWTQGFQYGSAILQFDATGETQFLELGRKSTLQKMDSHVSHMGVHDHGFNNISTYGNLLRLINEGRIEGSSAEQQFYELALKISGAVQASRWTHREDGGYIYSFNGPHSLFVDTIRTIRILEVSHLLGHSPKGEQDVTHNLMKRAIQHALTTAKYSIFYGEGRDQYDEWGRTAHECIFNTSNGTYRCANSQQGFSGFTTWTRGLSWAMLGFAEQLEFLSYIDEKDLVDFGGIEAVQAAFLKAAQATCDFYIVNSSLDGITYWDTGAPKLHFLEDYQSKKADPYNAYEPVDSSASAIGAQGLLRLGKYLSERNEAKGTKYFQAGLTIADALLNDPYLSQESDHQGLLLNTIYHYPNAWDYIPKGHKIPNGESCMWGDYHFRELMLLLHKMTTNQSYYTFFQELV
ncbi:glycosyl hydrolase [Fulvivirgaceae bacterium BMA10]|uniref:Glycosyl hydrolase n=1 Tax=Splendidivirga corallicola TaxID=3051826 RepID=A0ABT8KNQ2_9BACT|nr:glycosyl hydrolase [Fulvivirgaceae bacterium BMA10]